MKHYLLIFLLFLAPVLSFGEPVKVAFLAALTGMDPNTARELKRGLEVFQKEKPELAKLMTLTINDTKGDLEYTYKIMGELELSGIKVFAGLANSNEAMVAAKYTQDHKDVVFVTPFATNTKVTESSERAFRICFDDEKQGAFLSRFVQKNFPKSKILILENFESLYSKGLSVYFQNPFKDKKQIQVVTYSPNQMQYETALQKIETFNPDIVFIPDSSQTAALWVREIFKKNKKIQFLGGDGWGGNAVFHAIQGKEDDLKIIYSTYWHKNMPSSENRVFQNGYNKLFKDSVPSSGAAFTYDSLHLLGRALKNAKIKYGQSLASEIMRTKITSTTGPLKYTKNSRTPDRPIVLMQLMKGEYVVFAK